MSNFSATGVPAMTMKETEEAMKSLLDEDKNVEADTAALNGDLERLLSSFTAREANYTKAVKRLKYQYDSIIKEAEDRAAAILVGAETTAAEKVSKATEESTARVGSASVEASAILASANVERTAWEAEKASVADIQKFHPIVKVNVGGTKFTTSLTTLCRFPDTMIGAMYSGRHALPQDEDGYHFIDRDGTHFRYILNFLRSPESFECDLTGGPLKELKNECDYYGILSLMFPVVDTMTHTAFRPPIRVLKRLP